jgi:hypothetical protein
MDQFLKHERPPAERRFVGLLVCGLVSTALTSVALHAESPPAPTDNSRPAALVALSFEPPEGSPRAIEHVLRIDRAGRIAVHDPTGRQPRLTVEWTPQQARSLHRELLALCDQGRLSTEELQTALRAAERETGLSAEIPGADVSVLELDTPDGPIEVRCAAVALLVDRFPEIVPLQQLGAIQDRLLNVAAVVQVGGEAAADRLARAAADQSQQRHPDSPAWTARDLASVRYHPQGGCCVQFRRRCDQDAGCWTATLIETADRTVRVSVVPPEVVVR